MNEEWGGGWYLTGIKFYLKITFKENIWVKVGGKQLVKKMDNDK